MVFFVLVLLSDIKASIHTTHEYGILLIDMYDIYQKIIIEYVIKLNLSFSRFEFIFYNRVQLNITNEFFFRTTNFVY